MDNASKSPTILLHHGATVRRSPSACNCVRESERVQYLAERITYAA